MPPIEIGSPRRQKGWNRRLENFGGADIGESRPSGRRIIFEAPLGAMFRVNRSDRIITLSHVWRFRTS